MDAAASEYALKAFRQWAKRIAIAVEAEPHEYDEVPDRVVALVARVEALEAVRASAGELLAAAGAEPAAAEAAARLRAALAAAPPPSGAGPGS